MQPLNLPPYEARIEERNGKTMIFDILRRRMVALTPEEWVRQNFVHMLIDKCQYPASRMGNEVTIPLNGMKKRCDTVLYSQDMRPLVVIEYKAPEVEITPKVFDQICSYNYLLHAAYLMVSNGLKHYCCRIDYNTQQYSFLPDIPNWEQLKGFFNDEQRPLHT